MDWLEIHVWRGFLYRVHCVLWDAVTHQCHAKYWAVWQVCCKQQPKYLDCVWVVLYWIVCDNRRQSHFFRILPLMRWKCLHRFSVGSETMIENIHCKHYLFILTSIYLFYGVCVEPLFMFRSPKHSMQAFFIMFFPSRQLFRFIKLSTYTCIVNWHSPNIYPDVLYSLIFCSCMAILCACEKSAVTQSVMK